MSSRRRPGRSKPASKNNSGQFSTKGPVSRTFFLYGLLTNESPAVSNRPYDFTGPSKKTERKKTAVYFDVLALKSTDYGV